MADINLFMSYVQPQFGFMFPTAKKNPNPKHQQKKNTEQ